MKLLALNKQALFVIYRKYAEILNAPAAVSRIQSIGAAGPRRPDGTIPTEAGSREAHAATGQEYSSAGPQRVTVWLNQAPVDHVSGHQRSSPHGSQRREPVTSKSWRRGAGCPELISLRGLISFATDFQIVPLFCTYAELQVRA